LYQKAVQVQKQNWHQKAPSPPVNMLRMHKDCALEKVPYLHALQVGGDIVISKAIQVATGSLKVKKPIRFCAAICNSGVRSEGFGEGFNRSGRRRGGIDALNTLDRSP
jgi:hypothetical protein